MPRTAAKNRQSKPKRHGSYTPEPVRKRVLARHVSGESNRAIAIAEKIDRGTVGRILSQKEVVEKLAGYQSRLLELVPMAIRATEAALKSRNERIRMQAAARVLEGTGVLNRSGIEQAVAMANRASSPGQEERLRGVIGEIIDMTIQKHQTHNIPLPKRMSRVLSEGTGVLNRDE